jgi:hypothetical protein
MKHLIILFFIILSAPALSQTCQFKGKDIKVGKAVYIEDKALVADALLYAINHGKTEKEIQEHFNNADWLGYVLVCTLTYELNPSPNHEITADILMVSGAALVPVSHQADWINKLKAKK